MKSFFVLRFFLLNFLLLLLFSNFPQEAFATRAYNHEITQSEFRHSTSPSKKELRKELRAQRKAQKKVSQNTNKPSADKIVETLLVIALCGLIIAGGYYLGILLSLGNGPLGFIVFLTSIVASFFIAFRLISNIFKEKPKKKG